LERKSGHHSRFGKHAGTFGSAIWTIVFGAQLRQLPNDRVEPAVDESHTGCLLFARDEGGAVRNRLSRSAAVIFVIDACICNEYESKEAVV